MNPPAPPMSDQAKYQIQVREVTEYAMFLMDSDGYLTSWNAGVEKLLGYSESEWIGQHASIIFTPADQAISVCKSELKSAAELGRASDDRWHRRKDNTALFANGVVRAVYDDRGVLTGFAKILSDETARKQLEDSLTESNTALEQFALIAGHDLQEPLRTISTHAELLKIQYRGKCLDEHADELLDHVVNGARRMSVLIQDLLTYARLTTEMDRPSSISLDEDFETALTHLETAIEESHAVVTHEPLPNLRVDRGQMVLLFQNLIGNALKYRKPDEPPRVHASATQSGSDWIITVADNGIGFESKHAELIFAPFKRLHGPEDYPGTGIGLALCRRIVERHGGRIWAESAPQQGSRFHISLPEAGKTPSKYTRPVTHGLTLPQP